MKIIFPLATLFLLWLNTFSQPSTEHDYFQQKVDYTIRVSLDDKKHLLTGEETVSYTNNSPDSLKDLDFHLWPNAYKNDETALGNQLSKMGSNRMVVLKDQDFGYIEGLS